MEEERNEWNSIERLNGILRVKIVSLTNWNQMNQLTVVNLFPLNNRQNLLELNVYFQELEVMIVKEQPAYATESLIGEF